MITLINSSTNAFAFNVQSNGSLMLGGGVVVSVNVGSEGVVITPDGTNWYVRDGAGVSYDGVASSIVQGPDEAAITLQRFSDGFSASAPMLLVVAGLMVVRLAMNMVNDGDSSTE